MGSLMIKLLRQGDGQTQFRLFLFLSGLQQFLNVSGS